MIFGHHGKKARILTVWACLFAAIASHPTETAQAAFVPLGAGARGPGMGNAFTAVADDAHAVYYNPAGLALLSRPEFASSYTKLLMGLSDGSELGSSYLGYAHPIDGGSRGSLGTAWQSFSLNGGLYQENSFYLSYGLRFLEESGPGKLYGGASLKYLTRSFGALPEASNAMSGITATGRADPVLSGRNSMGTPDADLGLLYRLKDHYGLGLTLTHLTQPNVAFDKKDSDRLPLGVSLGFNYRGLLSNTGLQYDTRRSPTGTRDQILTVAAERWLPGRFLGDLGFRASLGMGTREFRQVTAGVSFRVRRLSVDYGFSMPLGTIASISGSHRLGFSLRFGAVSEPEESMLMILEAMRSLKGGKVPEFKAKAEGLSRSQKVILDEHLAIARSLQSQAKYQAALDRLGQALTVSPADPGLLKDFGRLNFVARPIKELPDYRGDPAQAALHESILAYLSGNDALAVDKAAYAHDLRPGDKETAGFLSLLELETGVNRPEAKLADPRAYRQEAALTGAASAIDDARYEEAARLSSEILQEFPLNAAAWEHLGTAQFALGDYRASLASLQKALSFEMDPEKRRTLKNSIRSVRTVIARGKPPKPVFTVPSAAAPMPAPGAAPPAADALVPPAQAAPPPAPPRAASPQEVQSLYNAGLDHYAAGDARKAAEAFKKVLELDPEHAPARKALLRAQEEGK